ncbi:hypothetical protein LTR10_006098 [Elasticomyces elasticus]|nr:hypothetical protein LTR10_006098 [Elasticomyces elasticus]KAK4966849.1 hypothetical protein LTR42_011162 [Elasticomyces elasticus]
MKRTKVGSAQATRTMATRSMARTSAFNGPFKIPELLEMLLLALPMRDLQRARAVCKFWKESVDCSIKIKRALFLEPGGIADVTNDCSVVGLSASIESAVIAPHLQTSIHCKGDLYSHHPLSIKPMIDNKGGQSLPFPNETLVRHANHSLRDVFLIQPPNITRKGAVVMVRVTAIKKLLCDPEILFDLDDAESFGTLYDRLERTDRLDDVVIGKGKLLWAWTVPSGSV